MACERCHAGPGGAPVDEFRMSGGDFAHSVHVAADVACSRCHASPGMDASATDCESCHTSHHQLDSDCLKCHRPETGVLAMHDVGDAHAVLCTRCHESGVETLTSWSRQVCTVCHVDQVEHEAPQPCESCHLMPARRN